MNIKENDQIPNVDIFVMENGEPVQKNTQVLLKDKKANIFYHTNEDSKKMLDAFIEI